MYKKSRSLGGVSINGVVIMNHLNQQRIDHFKNWIRNRFITGCDFHYLSAVDALAWSAALRELSQEVGHQVVPFHWGQEGDR
ncbi:hypothetical protein I8752_29135 [Nostocaceae cyanobacterium CENA369]|uniref:Uncharacterized protein n=1 Tax=Dendronalium phyllosphericum CENA369 TaxID=1725256 RepID=A0A8J7I6K8_9NOST|nr:hypothetical protein [Dendronalium phyllosphericum]MBH8576976.1 hypothetical protein [Dendronalium phyllosphericum CENA369]